jgi:hypothetical protein
MRNDTPIDFPTVRWCRGLPLAHTRPLLPAERRLLEGLRGSLLRLWLADLAAIGALVFGPAALIALLHVPQGSPREIDLALIALAAWAAGVPLVALDAVRRWKLRARCGRDLADGEALVFQRAEEDESEVAEAEAVASLVVFPHSCTSLVPRDDGRVRLWRVAVTEAAPPPSYAMRVPLPANVAHVEGDAHVQFLKRSFTPGERAELESHLRRHRRIGYRIAVPIAYCGLCLGALIAEPRGTLAAQGPVITGLQLLFCAITLHLVLRHVEHARKLRSDLDAGWVLTFHRRDEARDAREEDRAAVHAEHPDEGLEFLPDSLRVWARRGCPASWRNLRA